MRRPFRDRAEAGRVLAEKLADYAGLEDVIVLALPRGGVPVAYEVARALGAPLDVFLVRKLGAPGHEELAMGAIASGGVVVMNDEVVKAMSVRSDEILDAIAGERRELARREEAYRDGRRLVDARGGHGAAPPGPRADHRRRAGRRRVHLRRAPVDRRRLHLRRHPRALPRRRVVVRGFLPDGGRGGRRIARPRAGYREFRRRRGPGPGLARHLPVGAGRPPGGPR
jgi:hypothetical protein